MIAEPSPVRFKKYDELGAYHWEQCDRHSRNYNPPLEARYQVLLQRVPPSTKALDLGCGDGYLMSLLSPICESVVGIDPEPTAIEVATEKLRRFSNCSLHLGDGYRLPFPDESFNVVVLADVFEHLEAPERCLKEICRTLVRDGRLVLTTPKWRSDRRWDPVHVKEYEPDELLSYLRACFSQVELRFFWPLAWSNRYSTRVGWRLIKVLARYLYNPFLRGGSDPRGFGQILAICDRPF